MDLMALHKVRNVFIPPTALKLMRASTPSNGTLTDLGGGDTDTPDPIENASAGERENPVRELQQDIDNRAMLEAIGKLPTRQDITPDRETWHSRNCDLTMVLLLAWKDQTV